MMTLRDCMGREVPDRLTDAFAYRLRLSGLCFRLETLAGELLRALGDSHGQAVNQAVIERAVLVICNEVMENVPGHDCPIRVNKKHPPACRCCGGKQWLTPSQYEMASRRDPVSISPES
jgi:hypothetical protein